MSEIGAALANLANEQRAAVLYRDVLGLSYGETADRMGMSVNAVTMLLHRGRRRLREVLGVAAGAFGSWRWLREGGTPQVAAVKARPQSSPRPVSRRAESSRPSTRRGRSLRCEPMPRLRR
jgi:hypothetical protein